MYGYQDYPAQLPPVCAFKVPSGAQLKDFTRRGEVTELQIYYNRPAALDALKCTEFLEKYTTSSKKPKYYEDIPDTDNNVTLNRHFFKVHIDAAGIQYVYCPVRQVKRCICIEMLYVTSGYIFYLRLILLNKKAHSDQDVLTYNPVRGGGEPLVCMSYQQSDIAHGYVDSVDNDVHATFIDMCSNGTGAQYRSYFVVLSLNGYATHVIFDDHNKRCFMFMDYITYQGVMQDVAENDGKGQQGDRQHNDGNGRYDDAARQHDMTMATRGTETATVDKTTHNTNSL